MWITDISIRRPMTIFMFIMALVVLGFQSMKTMPVDLYPKIDIPYISIITVYRGAGSNEIETMISKPLEEAVASVNKVKNVTVSSQEGVSVVICEFQIGADLNVAASDIRDRLDTAKANLPRDADSPIIYKVDLNAMPVVVLGMSGSRSPAEVKRIADDVVKDRLGKVDGVASVSVTGGDTREIFVKVDQKRLKANGFNIMEIAQAIGYANLNVPAGNVKQGRKEFTVRVVGEFESPQELQDLKIRHQDPRLPGVVELKDIASVLDGSMERSAFTRLSGNDSVGIFISKQADANTVKVADGTIAEIEKLKKELPKDIKISVSEDNSTYIKDALHDVTRNLVEGSLLATLVVLLFLHIFSATFIVLLAIPTSIMATFILISSFGFSLNMMTLMGLAMCVGILVDDSIVVLENIFRHLTLGKDSREAALTGRMEIGGAAVAITLTDVVVFVPIAFMGGIVGQFFKEFGITVATATLFSLAMSFTLTPMLASRWLRKKHVLLAEGHAAPGARRGFWLRFFSKFNIFYDRLERRYRKILTSCVRHRWLVIISGNAALVVSVIVIFKFGLLGFEFFPMPDAGQFDVSIEMPVGTSVRETDRVTKQVERIIMNRKKYPDVDSVMTTVGEVSSMVGAGESGPQYANISVKLIDKVGFVESMQTKYLGKKIKGKRTMSVWDVQDELAKDVAGVPGPDIRMKTTSQNGPGRDPISIELTGIDTKKIADFSQKALAAVESTPGTRDVNCSWRIGRPEIHVKVDRLKAARAGLSVAQVAMTLRNSIEGSTDSKYREFGKEYDIRIRLGEADRRSFEDIRNVMLGGAMGRNILLKDVADVFLAEGPTKLERKNRQRLIKVNAQIAPGYTLGNVVQELKKKFETLEVSEDVNVHFGGEAEEMADSFGNALTALGLAVLLVYMLMCGLFESLLYPFIIMFSLPQALVGALWALVVTGKSFSLMSMIGIIMLIGLVTKNAILLIDYTNTLRKNGMARDEAVVEAGPVRLRPILMTTLTIILGNMPIALGLGAGSEMRSPMAVTVIGGLTLSLLLTLVVIPCTYTVMDDFSNFLGRILNKVFKRDEDDVVEIDAAPEPPAGGFKM